MNYLLDTNACIALLNGRPPQVSMRLQQAMAKGATFFLSCIALHELFYGAAKSTHRNANLEAILKLLEGTFEILLFDLEAAKSSGEIRTALERKGQRIGEYDTLIAGQAHCNNLILVTANTGESKRIAGLKIEDWSK